MPARVSVVPMAGCREPRVNDSSLEAVAQHDMCVILPNECPYEFVYPLDIDIMIDHPSCNSISSTPIGHCGSIPMGETRDCALTKDACHDPDSFVLPSQSLNHGQYANPNGGGCTVLQDRNYLGKRLDKGDGLTRFIGCSGGNIDSDDTLDAGERKRHVCVATIPECKELAGYDESVTITLSDPRCDCSETRVGACVRTGDITEGDDRSNFDYFCAATEEVCDNDKGLFYQDVNQLMRYSDIDCRLCDASAVEEYKFAVSNATSFSVHSTVGIFAASILGAALLWTLFRCRKNTHQHQESSTLNEAPEDTTSPSLIDQNECEKNNNNGENDLATVIEEVDEEDVKVLQATFT